MREGRVQAHGALNVRYRCQWMPQIELDEATRPVSKGVVRVKRQRFLCRGFRCLKVALPEFDDSGDTMHIGFVGSLFDRLRGKASG